MATVEIQPVAAAVPVAVATPVSTTAIDTSKLPTATGVPLTQTMERVLGPLEVVSVQQTPRGCLQECFGCSAQSEYKIYPGFAQTMPGLNDILPTTAQGTLADKDQIGHMLEESPFCPDRCFWSGMRKFSIPIKVPNQDGEIMMYNEKDFSMPTHCIVHGDNGDLPIPCW